RAAERPAVDLDAAGDAGVGDETAFDAAAEQVRAIAAGATRNENELRDVDGLHESILCYSWLEFVTSGCISSRCAVAARRPFERLARFESASAASNPPQEF